MLGSALPPEQIPEIARLGESLGYGELWLAEDYFYTGGISGAAAALGVTQHIPVGLGIVSAMVRHPAVLAMELSTLARTYPGRLMPGIGLGVPGWIQQMGVHPKSTLAALRECVTSVRALLQGDEISAEGQCFRFDKVKLAYPVAEPVPLYMGVIGPKMLQLSGEIADGTVGSVLASPAYLRWAREQIATGSARVGRKDGHRFAVFSLFSVDRDARKAKEALRPLLAFYLAAVPKSALGDAYGITEELVEMAQGGFERVSREMPAKWLEDLAIAGDPEECAAKIQRLREAGADSVILFPTPLEQVREIVKLAADEVLPRVF